MKKIKKLFFWLLIIALFAYAYQNNVTDLLKHKKVYMEAQVYKGYGKNMITEYLTDQVAQLEQFPMEVENYYFFTLGIWTDDKYLDDEKKTVTIGIFNRVFYIGEWFEEEKDK